MNRYTLLLRFERIRYLLAKEDELNNESAMFFWGGGKYWDVYTNELFSFLKKNIATHRDFDVECDFHEFNWAKANWCLLLKYCRLKRKDKTNKRLWRVWKFANYGYRLSKLDRKNAFGLKTEETYDHKHKEN